MYIAFAVFLVLHGFAHLVGFAGSWGLSANIVPQTALLNGRIPLSLDAVRVMGILWAVLAGAFVVAAVGVARQEPWWAAATIFIASASFVMCVFGLPGAKIGVLVNAAIIATVLLLLLLRNGPATV